MSGNLVSDNLQRKHQSSCIKNQELNLHEQNLVHAKPNSSLQIHKDVLSYVGQTPLIRINKVVKGSGIECDILAKCEMFNPGGSLKDRVAISMIRGAEAQGTLKPGDTIIEPTSGNTGVSIAMAAAVLGYKCILVLTEKMTKEKADTIKALGGIVIRASMFAHEDSPDSHINVAKRLAKVVPNSVVLDQYSNLLNAYAHEATTAEEILEACDYSVDMVVAGAGTCGTISGIGRKMKKKSPNTIVVAVEPVGSLLQQCGTTPETTQKSWIVEGIGHKFHPGNLDHSVIDRWVQVTDDEGLTMARRLIAEEGLLVGGSSGAIVAAAIKAAKQLKKGQRCVAVLADGIRNYLTHFVDDNWMASKGFDPPTQGPDWADCSTDTIAKLNLQHPHSVPIDFSVAKALETMKSENVENMLVRDCHRVCVGLLSLKNMEFALAAEKAKQTDNVSVCMFSKFGVLDKNASFKDVLNAFRTFPYIALMKNLNECIGSMVVCDEVCAILDPIMFFSQAQAATCSAKA